MRELVEKLKREGVLRSGRVIEAFLANDRKEFILPEWRDQVYEDAPLPIGSNQTISQPYTVAFMLELLDLGPGQRVLDVGFGSGWTTALMAFVVGDKGAVYGLEIVEQVFEFGRANLEKFDYKNIELKLASAWKGWKDHAPFDRILVSAAAPEVPVSLKEQLKPGGKIVIPVGGGEYEGGCPIRKASAWKELFSFGQSIKVLEKLKDNKFREQDYSGFAFVPLVK